MQMLIDYVNANKGWLLVLTALAYVVAALARKDIDWTPTVPAKYRPFVALGIGIAVSLLEALGRGVPVIGELMVGVTGGGVGGLLVAAHDKAKPDA